MTTIIDISEAQGRPDFDALCASGRVDGVICKATEGNGYEDAQFARNVAESFRVALLFGVYHFAHPDWVDLQDPEKEARHFVETVKKRAGDAHVRSWWLDIEEARKVHAGNEFTSWVRRFIVATEALTGQQCDVYTGGPFFKEHAGALSPDDEAFFAARRLWLAAYVNNPAPYAALTPWRQTGATLHQFSGDVGPGGARGIHYPGITGNVVDTSRFAGSYAELCALFDDASRRDTIPAPAPDREADTFPGTPTSKSNQRLRALDVPIIEVPNAADFVRSLADEDPEPPEAA